MRFPALTSFALGTLTFVATELGWLLFALRHKGVSRWVLEPTPGIGLALLAHFLAALAFSAALKPSMARAGAFLAGAMFGVIGMLVVVGPGNLWPIVLVIDFVILAVPLGLGLALGRLFRHTAKAVE